MKRTSARGHARPYKCKDAGADSDDPLHDQRPGTPVGPRLSEAEHQVGDTVQDGIEAKLMLSTLSFGAAVAAPVEPVVPAAAGTRSSTTATISTMVSRFALAELHVRTHEVTLRHG